MWHSQDRHQNRHSARKCPIPDKSVVAEIFWDYFGVAKRKGLGTTGVACSTHKTFVNAGAQSEEYTFLIFSLYTFFKNKVSIHLCFSAV